jgi:hypothetical protein
MTRHRGSLETTTSGAEYNTEARDNLTAADGRMAGEQATAQVMMTGMTTTVAATTHPAIREEASTIIGRGSTKNQMMICSLQ